MNPQLLRIIVVAAVLASGTSAALAEQSTPAPSDAEKEAFYANAIEIRVSDILKGLNLTEAAKSNAVHDALVAQYHALRVRDAAIDTQLKVDGKPVNYENRAPLLAAQNKPLHDQFLAKLSENLTPEEVEKVKDLMTYNKVKATSDAYALIVPGLTDADKAKILELLKSAREEAVDGGSAPEKSAIFQKYKDQINDYLNANGHDTVKAFKEWADAHPNTNSPAAK
ncbi:MAG TPA: DUF3826 domain-containing protein [Verrucomicrobiae bacterium]|nr:DUF3826 domain-containing protein [Verrucomicrobiae bacterium]